VCSISLPVAAAFVGRALSAALTGVFNTARPYAYLPHAHRYFGGMASAACISGLPHIIFSA